MTPGGTSCEVKTLRQDLEDVINRHSAENESNTPDFILAGFLVDCLETFDHAVRAREKWYGREVGQCKGAPPLCGAELNAPSMQVLQSTGHAPGDGERRGPDEGL